MSLEGSVVSERPITAIAIRHQMIVQYKVRGEGWDMSNLYDSSRCAKQRQRTQGRYLCSLDIM